MKRNTASSNVLSDAFLSFLVILHPCKLLVAIKRKLLKLILQPFFRFFVTFNTVKVAHGTGSFQVQIVQFITSFFDINHLYILFYYIF